MTVIDRAIVPMDPVSIYRQSFAHFREAFAKTTGDVRWLPLPSVVPPGFYDDPPALEPSLTGALLAMLDHTVAVPKLATMAFSLVSSYVLTQMPKSLPEAAAALDQIVLAQLGICGLAILFGCDLVKSLTYQWERNDYDKYKKMLRALDKAARVHQGKLAAPLGGPFLPDVKAVAVAELTPVLALLQARFKKQRTDATPEQIWNAFLEEVRDTPTPWLVDRHNLALWQRFIREHSERMLMATAPALFDEFVAYITKHSDPEYVRQRFSSRG